MGFSKRLQKLRNAHSLTQRQVFEATNVYLPRYELYESGTREPSHADLLALADYFNVSLDYIVGRSNDPAIRNLAPAQCFKCKCTDNDVKASFCKNCGYDLRGNYCTDIRCALNDRDAPIRLSDTSCFCDVCGAESSYYKEGLITPRDFSNRHPE